MTIEKGDEKARSERKEELTRRNASRLLPFLHLFSFAVELSTTPTSTPLSRMDYDPSSRRLARPLLFSVVSSSRPETDSVPLSLPFPFLPTTPSNPQNLRESIGTHTCDARSTCSSPSPCPFHPSSPRFVPFSRIVFFSSLFETAYFLATTFSRLANPSNPLNYDFEPGFTVNDELWKPDVRESSGEQQGRTRRVLGEVFDGVKGDCESFLGTMGFGVG